jgi:biotin-(acetyl-CoA carboxylase) ligase
MIYVAGRGDNVWISPGGSLSVSFKLGYANGSTLPFVQYLVSLAVVRGIKSLPGCEVSAAF